MLTLHLILALTSPSAAADLDLAGARIVVSEKATDMEIFAARELSRYFRLICGKESPVVASPTRTGGEARVIVRTLPPAAPLPPREKLGDQGYQLQVLSVNPPALTISAETPIGVQYGVYSLLERLGVGFYLGGDALPERREQLLIPDNLNETNAPVFAIRGSLPWYNFLNSPTTWDLEDYEVFFDQMAKMKDNFVGFHSYDHEPFGAYPYEGQWRMGQPAATSLTYWWGALGHLKTSEFGFGTGRYFPYEVFGSRSAVLAQQPKEPSPEGAIFPHRTLVDDTIVRAQCVLAQGLQYAKMRGVKTCFGFELVGDPTDPEQRRQEEARIRHTLATYPMIDYLWFWQSEGLGGGSKPAAPDSPLDLIVQRYRPVFQYLGNEERIAEAARVAAWVQWADALVKRLRPDLKVVVSGWGGDAWMRFSDFYVGLDQVLPKDIVFSALDNIDPTSQDHVSEAYGKLSPDREKWPIPWFSSDGGGTRRDQWGPQCNVKPFTALVRDAQKKGCQGLLGIHWETRGVEEVAAYCAQFAWSPALTYEDFYGTFARKCFGEKHGPEMAQILMRLEALGPRWTGGPGQVECGGFQWFSDDRRPKPENMAALERTDTQLAAIEQECGEGPARRHLERLQYLRATIRFLTKFDEAALKLAPGGSTEALITQAEKAKEGGNAAEAERLANQAIEELTKSTLAEAMQAYRHRLTSQGDFGNLATINDKAYAAFLGLWERAVAVLGKKVPPPVEAAETGPPTVVLRTLPSAALVTNRRLLIEALVASSSPIAHVSVHIRTREERWLSLPMTRGAGGGPFAAVVPANLSSASTEFYVVATDEAGRQTSAPPGAPEAVHSMSNLPYHGAAIYGPALYRGQALAPWGGDVDTPSALAWTVLPAHEYLSSNVHAQAGPLKQDLKTIYHLAAWPTPAGLRSLPTFEATCRVEWPGSVGSYGGLDRVTDFGARGPVVRFARPDPPGASASATAEAAGPFLARVTWEPVPGAATYEVHRSAEPNFTPGEQTRVAQWPWTTYEDVGLRSNVTYEWAIAAIDDAGQRGPFVRTRDLFIPDQPLAKPPTGVVATPGLGRVTLKWQPTGEAVSGYAVFARPEAAGDWQRVSGERAVKETTYVVGGLNDTQPRLFSVRSIDRSGRDGETAEAVRAAALPTPQEPVFATTFRSTKADTGQQGQLGGKATIHDGVLDTREGGWIAYPGEELLQAGGPLSVELWTNIERVEGIPVVLSFGHFQGPGYWLQLFMGSIRWYLPEMRILDVGATLTGAWHHLAATYDGNTSRVYVDGKEVGTKEIGPLDLAPWPGELRVGQYSDLEDQFQTRAQFRQVRIYQRCLSAQEVGKSFESDR